MERVRGFEFVNRVKDIKDKKLPERSTKNSAGYDFFCQEDIKIPSSYVKFIDSDTGVITSSTTPSIVKTGIKSYMMDDEVLYLFNRSSNPVKRNLVLANSVGVIDSDYYNNEDNEGEIGFLFYNLSDKDVVIKKGDKIGQGVFSKFLKIDEEGSVLGLRKGGIGSTGK